MVMWTKDQQNAIDARESNLLIAAAAGSGKTAVLVERIIQLIIKDKIDIDRLLIVTFTNAAAGEMRERIGAAILKELEKKDKNEEHLRKQINLLNRASISTLHSFCINVVRKYFHLIDIDPNFRIGDGTETSIMKAEALEELFEKEYEKAEEGFIGLVERFGGNKEDTPLLDLVLRLYGFIQSKPYPKEWLKEKVEEFSLEESSFDETTWHKAIVDQICIALVGAKEVFIESKNLCQKPLGPAGYHDAILEDIHLIDELRNGLRLGLNVFYDILQNAKHKRLGRLSKDVDEVLKEEVKGLREQGKEIIKDIKEDILMKHPQEYVKDLNELYPYMRYLYNLVNDFESMYHEKKIEKGIVDFNDLEHYALRILQNEQVAKEYEKKFAYIFVDEYQDSNIVQETILGFIKRENNLFMVGDVKQSIYRFRLADPTLFIEKYETYEEDSESLNRRIDLSKNFRSRAEVIDGINFIFKNIMTKEFGEIDYDESAYLYKGAEYEPLNDLEIELNIIEKNKEEVDVELEELEELEDMEVEARIVAKRIKELIDQEIYDNKLMQYRKINYKDMVVLLRATKNWAQTFLEVFIEEGIPAYADINTGYFEAIEVNIFMNLLKVIDNKMQDIPLLSIMRSPIGGFNTEEMIQIRMHSKEKTYFEAVQEYMKTADDPLSDKCVRFLKKIKEWKEVSRYIHIDEFIWKLLKETGYYDYIGAMPGGVQRQANLRILADRARQFQNTSIKGLFNFIKFIDKLKNSSGDMGTAKTLGENDKVVRIMSIHKSKGLEFPVVIVAGMGKQFNLMDINSQVLFHKDLGIGPKYVDPNLRQYTDTIAKIAMKYRIKIESLSEEMRILYVALTRAKDKLILLGSIRDIEKSAKKWMGRINPFYLSRSKSYLDWIGSALIRHKDGEKLRAWAGVVWDKALLLEDDSKWIVKKINKKDIQTEEVEKKINKLAFKKVLNDFQISDPQDKDFVDKRLNWYDPNKIATQISSKLSVTEIKRISFKELAGMGMNIPALIQKPKFMDAQKDFTPAQKGTIIHFIMQHLDLKHIESKGKIEEQLRKMVRAELLKPEEADVVDILKIITFFKSNIGERILKSQNVFREVPFNYVKKAVEVIPDLENCKENLLIQGVIDCYFEEEDGYVLVDYKTDYVGFGHKEETVEKYRVQVALYKEALEKITQKRVKDSFIYLFYLDEEMKL
ncbi:helicase-exonuclease AddAB subunit AddA [Marinisporobacter balticus]|uniref:ATP-dependent helicase/nuclease subunit A n=1 Tax=Marinisporobacter balticus TaxID=2018667 RepID=A0A4R2K4X1_9FIRM|nr:helicase-exonuclease AddAB subunit AddA [Marinisporobacter balticus]TCO68251.1 DNA helicase/exodeoxyribonuclease V subunit A [Marinisporobacter balticus]